MEKMKTLPSSWKASISLLLSQRANQRIAIMGIGNTLRSDDAAGILVARALMETRLIRDLTNILILDAGHAPENRTADLRRFQPDIVLLIDAAEMGETPGTIRWIEMDEIEGISASTHSLPLSMLASYLNWELKCEVLLLGIQPANTDMGETVHSKIVESATRIVKEFQGILQINPS